VLVYKMEVYMKRKKARFGIDWQRKNGLALPFIAEYKGKTLYTETAMKNRLIELYGRICMYCGLDLSNISVHLDHIIPKSKGGVDTIGNRALACKYCNMAKHTNSLEEFKRWLQHIRSNQFRSML
jgi:5-methylcytosine-specific restriction endonuclease McrA